MCASLDGGVHRGWAWGSVRRPPALLEATRARIEPGIHVAMGLPGSHENPIPLPLQVIGLLSPASSISSH